MADAGSPRRGWGGAVWVLALAGVLFVAGLIFVLSQLKPLPDVRGDGRHVDSYGFDLSNLSVERSRLQASPVRKEGIPSLDEPPFMPGSEIEAFNEAVLGNYLRPADRVVGVQIGERARAYPVRVLWWHEIVNDVFDGVPIAVTFHQPSDSAVVVERIVEGEVVEFGVSGLFYNSNLLMFDRRESDADESLWSQLDAEAVAGVRAGARLRVIPCSLTRWDEWLDSHPDTEVVEPTYERLGHYRNQSPFGSFLLGDRPLFRVDPMPPGGLHPLTPVVVIGEGESVAVHPLVAGRVDTIRDRGVEVRIDTRERPYRRRVLGSPDLPVRHTLWFVWYSHHPRTAEARLAP